MARYLTDFTFPDADAEFSHALHTKLNCYNTYYPFQVLSKTGLHTVEFAPITILYGGNGSGKTTALNVIASRLGMEREGLYNRSSFWDDYVGLCSYTPGEETPARMAILTSDDVFDFMLNLRSMNEGIDRKREELLDEYMEMKYSAFQLRSLDDYDRLRKMNQARSHTQSRYARDNNVKNVREHSNGESALLYFTEKIKEDGLYLLDEPENSLSAERQQELAHFLEESVRFFGCQLVLSTHSPFLLAMKAARVYNLDGDPARVQKWTELDNIRTYYDFFKKHREEFEK